jgi:mono/diheme cytochrome c family protein
MEKYRIFYCLRRFSPAAAFFGGLVLVGLAAGHRAVAEPVPAAPETDPHAAARALLLDRCTDCHGADGAESGLRLDSRAGLLRGGDFGPAVVLGKGATSELIRRVTSGNADEVMPPDGPRLSADEVAALTAWIDAGAGRCRAGRGPRPAA